MSEDTDNTDDGTEKLNAEAVAQLAKEERRAKKTIRFETPDGEAEYEYQMIREGRLAELSEKHFETPEVRNQRHAKDRDLTADDFERFRAEVIKESVVSAPHGHKAATGYIRKNIPDNWQAELFDAITEFSIMQPEERRKFL